MFRKAYKVKNASSEDIQMDVRYREDAKDAPVIIVLHGFKGFKDWGFFPDLSEHLAEAGYVIITPNLSRNGIGFDFNTFQNLEKFAENTHSHELEDLKTIINNIKDETIARKVADPDRIGLLGHSRGGGLTILAAAELGDTISTTVTWASVSTFFRYSDDQKNQWEKNGFIEIENSRTKQMMRMNKSFWDDLNKNKSRFDILKSCSQLENPVLFIHGKDDTSVPFNESEQLHDACGSYVKRLELIDEADHTFGIKHPMEKKTDQYSAACEMTEIWFDNYLNI